MRPGARLRHLGIRREQLLDEQVACVRQLRDLLEESVRLRLIADVPLGAFLSGGIDSSAVVATMARISSSSRRVSRGTSSVTTGSKNRCDEAKA